MCSLEAQPKTQYSGSWFTIATDYVVSKGPWLLALGLVTILALVSLFPLYWMTSGSLKRSTSAMRSPPELFPSKPTLVNYRNLFTQFPAFRWIGNSTVVAGAAAMLSLLFSSMAGYAFGKKDFPGKSLIFSILLSAMMMPFYVILIPLFLRFRDLGLVNTYLGMILPLVGWPFGIFLVRQFMALIPRELIDAAKVDGASELQVYWRIVLPIAKPAMGALGIFAFVTAWNDYIWQLVIVNDPAMMTLPVAVSTITRAELRVDVGLLMTGATVAFVPMFVVFLLLQDYFIRGVTVGALKG